MTDINRWGLTNAPPDNSLAPPDGFPEGMPYRAVNDAARELMAALARWYADHNGSVVTSTSSGVITVALNRTAASGSATDEEIGSFVARVPSATGAATSIRVNNGITRPLHTPNDSRIGARNQLSPGLYSFVYNRTGNRWQTLSGLGLDIRLSTIVGGIGANPGPLLFQGRPVIIGEKLHIDSEEGGDGIPRPDDPAAVLQITNSLLESSPNISAAQSVQMMFGNTRSGVLARLGFGEPGLSEDYGALGRDFVIRNFVTDGGIRLQTAFGTVLATNTIEPQGTGAGRPILALGVSDLQSVIVQERGPDARFLLSRLRLGESPQASPQTILEAETSRITFGNLQQPAVLRGSAVDLTSPGLLRAETNSALVQTTLGATVTAGGALSLGGATALVTGAGTAQVVAGTEATVRGASRSRLRSSAAPNVNPQTEFSAEPNLARVLVNNTNRVEVTPSDTIIRNASGGERLRVTSNQVIIGRNFVEVAPSGTYTPAGALQGSFIVATTTTQFSLSLTNLVDPSAPAGTETVICGNLTVASTSPRVVNGLNVYTFGGTVVGSISLAQHAVLTRTLTGYVLRLSQ